MATDISNKNLHWRVGNRTYGNGAAQYMIIRKRTKVTLFLGEMNVQYE